MACFEGGQVSKHIAAWKNLTSDKNILQTVRGEVIDFSKAPPSQHFAANATLTTEEKSFVNSEIKKLLNKKVIVETIHERKEFVSPVFLTKKSDGGHRLILNLKKLNEFIKFEHFKMSSISNVLEMIYENCYMATVDLKDAYYSVKMHEKFQCYLKFAWDEKLYKFVCFPNGLSPCPRRFTKLTNVPMSHLRIQKHPICGYIDDFITCGKTPEKCSDSVGNIVSIFQQLGFVIHPEKSQLKPSQQVTFLGFIINSVEMSITLTEKRKNNLRHHINVLLSIKKPTIRLLAKVIGHIVSAMPSVKFGMLYYRKLESEKVKVLDENFGNFDSYFNLSDLARAELLWWKKNIPNMSSWIHPPPVSDTIYTDSSEFAWGSVFDTQKTGGAWSFEEASLHINIKEMIAIFFTVKSFFRDRVKRHVQVFCDNTTAVAGVNKMGSSKCKIIDAIAHQLWEYCQVKDIWITCTHIPGSENQGADTESRKAYKDSEWKLNPMVFKRAISLFGFVPNIDCFATRINCQLPRYISYRPDPSATFINTFTVSLSGFDCYFFPPFSLIGKVLQKIKVDRLKKALIVVPQWPTRPWYTTLQDMLVQEPLVLKPSHDLLILPSAPSESHPLWKKLRLMICLVSGECY